MPYSWCPSRSRHISFSCCRSRYSQLLETARPSYLHQTLPEETARPGSNAFCSCPLIRQEGRPAPSTNVTRHSNHQPWPPTFCELVRECRLLWPASSSPPCPAERRHRL